MDAVEVSVSVVFDFRLALGKYPRALRGMRRISIASEKLGKSTQESCFRLSSSAKDTVTGSDGGVGDATGSLWVSRVLLPLCFDIA